MAIETASLRRNLSRLEVAVAVLIIAVLFAVFMNRVSHVEAAAEKAILIAQFQDMQTRLLTLKVSFVLQEIQGRPPTLHDVVRHVGRGDLEFIESERAFDWESVDPGAWVYFEDVRRIEYRVISEDYFEVEKTGPKRVRFQVEPRYVDINDNGRFDDSVDRLDGAVLKLLDPGAFSTREADMSRE
ncbi:MAG: hypothetical protein O7B81_09670 [Gammaproteobacteria bacterium]|nr:hypothetical protein [Gammaproteobacteria bacterium]